MLDPRRLVQRGFIYKHKEIVKLFEESLMKAPNKHVIALINYIALVPLVYFIPEFVHPMLPENKLLQVAVDVAIIVPIIAYVVLPTAMKIFFKQE